MPVLNVWSQHSTDLQFDEFLNVILIYGVGDDKQSNLKRINMIKFTVPKCYVTQVRRGLYGPYSLLKCKNMVTKRVLIFFFQFNGFNALLRH